MKGRIEQAMKKITVSASREYDVLIESGLLPQCGSLIRQISDASSAIIVTDDNVDPLYSDAVNSSVRSAGFRVGRFVFPHGEASKNISTWSHLLEYLCAFRLTRSDIIIALGGGVVGDLAGFAAACWQRGIQYVQIPTTLLAMVDSSVGGKTAVDLSEGKNMVGAFHQPSLVICDPDVLSTLPEEEYRCGCAEVIKYGMIGSEPFFRRLEARPVREQAEDVIAACVEMKRRFVLEDEFDTGLRMMLNFGHTFGHAAEACSRFSILHGQGVAIGMCIMARAACARGILSPEDRDALIDLVRLYGLPSESFWPAEQMAAAAASDKKSAGSNVRIIVPESIGRCRIEKIPVSDLKLWLHDGGVK